MIELVVLYHGTKFKYVADQILKVGFKTWTFFSRDLNDALRMGGKYVFTVVFDKADIPDNWQVRCENQIPPDRIIQLYRFPGVPPLVHTNKKLLKDIFNHALTHPGNDYCFKEKRINLNELI
jgi:hypothetical protein